MNLYAFRRGAAAIAAWLLVSVAHGAVKVGTTSGAFSVGSSGAATYSIPIRVASGVGGVQPQLFLVYNSQAGNGQLGIGWSLAGLSSIARCPQTIAQDGRVRGVKYDAEDKLCLDGKRLLVVNNVAYGKDLAEYRTEDDAFAKIIGTNFGYGQSDAFTNAFQVYTKDGLVMTYGHRVVAENKSTITAVWALSEIKDTKERDDAVGNKITFNYDDYHNGEFYLKNVTYGEFSGVPQAGDRVLSFQYEPRNDVIRGYENGSLTAITKRLTVIESTVGNSGAVASRYKLQYGYETPGAGARSRLMAITECGINDLGIEDCLNPTTFEWQSTDPDFIESDMVPSGSCRNSSGNNGCDTDPNYFSVQYPDLNGDGVADICYMSDNGLRCRLGTPERLWKPEVATYIKSSNWDNIIYSDFNGDGRQDLLVRRGDGLHVYTWNSIDNGFTEYNASDLCADSKVIYDAEGTVIGGYCFNLVGTAPRYRLYAVDINGDHLSDLCYLSYYDGVVCHLNIGNGKNGVTIWGGAIKFGESGICSYRDTGCVKYDGYTTASKTIPIVTFHDIDGDGLEDVVSQHRGGISVYRSTGNGFAFYDASPICAGGTGSDGCNSDDNYSTLQFPDINGDGLPDLCYRSDTGVMCHLGTAQQGNVSGRTQWGAKISTGICDNNICGDTARRSIQYVDINADGRSDLIYLGGSYKDTTIGIKTFISKGDGFVEKHNTVRNMCAAGSTLYGGCDNANNQETITFADVNGDGKQDLVYRSDRDGALAWVQEFKHSSIISITDGNGAVTNISYDSLNDSDAYQFSDIEDVLSLSQGCAYPIVCGPSPAQVVTHVATSNGVDGTNTQKYHYYDMRTHIQGLGSLGFGYMDTLDIEKGVLTQTTYKHGITSGLITPSSANREAASHVGMPLIIKTSRATGSDHAPLSNVKNTYKTKIITHANGTQIAYPYASESVSTQYDLDSSVVIVTKTTINDVDTYGNVKSQTVSVGRILDDPYAYITTTTSKYEKEDPNNWYLGRVTRSEVTASAVDSQTGIRRQETRVTAFDYYPRVNSPSDPVYGRGGLLKTTDEEPGDPNLHLTTTYTYDKWGNKSIVTIKGDPLASNERKITERSSSNTYTYSGGVLDPLQYQIESTDALGFKETRLVDKRTGNTVSLTGPNGLATRWKYDAFGRKLEELRSDGTRATWSYDPCQNGDSCPTYGLYKITTKYFDATGGTLSAPTTVYYSALAQELRTETIGFNGSKVLQDTQYDEFGRVWRKSRAYFAGVNPSYWTTYTYDELDRPKQIVNPDGSTVSMEYSGLETTITRERRGENGYTAITAKQIKNLQGKIAEAYDAIGSGGGTPTGSRTLYSYHPFGELETVTPQNNGGADTSISYDKRGRKLSMDDPDMGHWEYKHDALGNLRWQKDAKGQVTVMEYDLLNRLVKRTDQKNTPSAVPNDVNAADDDIAKWDYYGTTAPPGSRGKLYRTSTAINNGTVEVFRETYVYDAQARLKERQTVYDGVTEPYTVTNTYAPNSSRIDSVLYPKSEGNSRYKLANAYNSNGYLKSVSGGIGAILTKLWEPVITNAAGDITWEVLGNGITTYRGYDAAKGSLTSIMTGPSGAKSGIQDLEYGFDSLGNLEWRRDNKQKDLLTGSFGVKEAYSYDAINRLTTVTRNGLTTQAYQYDSLGNITFNSRYGNYTYGENGAGLHAVTSVKRTANGGVMAGDANADKAINSLDTVLVANQIIGNSITVTGGNPDCNTNNIKPELHDTACISRKLNTGAVETFEYDPNGNMIYKRAAGAIVRTVTYTSFNKPATIASGTTTLSFAYGPDRDRYMQTIRKGTQTETLHYIGKLFERLKKSDGTFEFKNYLYAGGRMVAIDTRYSDPAKADRLEYVHQDHLGSIDAVTSSTGMIVERSQYTPFGEQLAGVVWKDNIISQLNLNITRRGYTNHELLADVGLVHMNGRVYDPQLGRFLSADPHVQYPDDAQSYNRYSYVMNNPLSAVDPSGYFLKHLVQSAMGYIRHTYHNFDNFMKRYGTTVMAIGMTAIAPNPFLGGFISGMITSGGDLKAATLSAVTAVAFAGLHDMGVGFGKVLAHGMVGGISSRLQGGSFKSGFASAAFTQGFSQIAGEGVFGGNIQDPMVRIKNAFAAGVIGGTSSVIAGGKFENGAMTGAFSRMFNDLQQAPYMHERIKTIGSEMEPIGEVNLSRETFWQNVWGGITDAISLRMPALSIETTEIHYQKMDTVVKEEAWFNGETDQLMLEKEVGPRYSVRDMSRTPVKGYYYIGNGVYGKTVHSVNGVHPNISLP